MKEKILVFIIGGLVGAIIATTGFYIYSSKTAKTLPQGNNAEQRMFKGGDRMPPDGMPNDMGEGNSDFKNKMKKRNQDSTDNTNNANNNKANNVDNNKNAKKSKNADDANNQKS